MSKMSKLSPIKRREEVFRMYTNGISVVTISKELNVCAKTIYRDIDYMRNKMAEKLKSKTPEQIIADLIIRQKKRIKTLETLIEELLSHKEKDYKIIIQVIRELREEDNTFKANLQTISILPKDNERTVIREGNKLDNMVEEIRKALEEESIRYQKECS